MNIKNVWNHHLVIYVHLGSFVVWEKTVERTSTSQKKKTQPVTCRACSIIAACSMTSRKWSMATWMLLMLLLSLFEHDFHDNFTFSHMITQGWIMLYLFSETAYSWHQGNTESLTYRSKTVWPCFFFLEKLIAHHSPTKNSSQKSPDLQLKWLIGELVSDIQEVTWNISKGPDLCGWSGHSHELQLQCTFPHLPPAGHRTRWKSSRLTWDP